MGRLIVKADKVLTPVRELRKVAIVIERSKIKKVIPWSEVSRDKDTLYYPRAVVTPGFIDIHTHGYGGYSATTSGKEGLIKIAESLPKHGVTSFYPTTASESQDVLLEACGTIKKVIGKKGSGSEILGIHLEGPHFGTGEERGAQNLEVLRDPDVGELKELVKVSENNIRRVTLAPELPGALEYIKRARELGIVAAAGHTSATYEEAIMGINAGVTLCNHLYNGMRSFHHREPGIIGACLTRDDVYVEMIADMIHLHPAAIKIAVNVKGLEKTIIITDSIPQTNIPDGEYELSGLKTVVKDGISRIKKTGRLAGSTLTMEKAIRNVVNELGIDLKDAVRMATLNPAEVLNLSKRGKLAPGYVANLTVLDSELNVLATVVNGELHHRSD